MSVLDTALEFCTHGYCAIPVRADGSKAPFGEWRGFQTHRSSPDQIRRWLASGRYDGIGLVCGHVSGNLEMLELEGRAVAANLGMRIAEIADASGLGEIWKKVTSGYTERTPSGGLHFLYRVNGAVSGNTKLARRPATPAELAANPGEKIKVLVETRGEGGFTVVAPSGGRTHPSGRSWELLLGGVADIAVLDPDERDALHILCRAVDELGEVEAAPVPATHSRAATARSDGPDVAGSYNEGTVWDDLLVPHGWVPVYAERGGTTRYWRRPGKRVGISASTGRNDADNLYVFSTSTEFDAERPYSRFAAYAVLYHGGDLSAAGKKLYADGYGTHREPFDDLIVSNGAAGEQKERPGEPPSGSDPPKPVITGGADHETATPVLAASPVADGTGAPRLPEAFWNTRGVLEHVRVAARASLVAPDALLGAVLARVSMLTDYRLHLPELPRRSPLNVIVALCGNSGEGKGAAMDAAQKLLPAVEVPCLCGADDHRGDHAKVPAGSGEGMVRNFFDLVSTKVIDDKGKTRVDTRMRIDRRHILVSIDEGEVLASLAGRTGQTTMQILRQAWSGEELGFSYSNADKNLRVPAHSYRQSVVLGIQPVLADKILDDIAGGTPQRFVWFGLYDPDIPAVPPPWPGDLGPYCLAEIGQPWTEGPMGVEESIAREIVGIRQDRVAQRIEVPLMDSHRNLCRLKTAGLLARLDRRFDITSEDWHLAGMVQDTSDAVRAWVGESIAANQRAESRKLSYARAMTTIEMEETIADAAVRRAAKAIMRKLGESWTPRRSVRRDMLASKDRPHFEDAITLLVSQDLVQVREVAGQGQSGIEYRRMPQTDSGVQTP